MESLREICQRYWSSNLFWPYMSAGFCKAGAWRDACWLEGVFGWDNCDSGDAWSPACGRGAGAGAGWACRAGGGGGGGAGGGAGRGISRAVTGGGGASRGGMTFSRVGSGGEGGGGGAASACC